MIFQTVFIYTRNKLHKLVKNLQQCAVTLCIVAKHRERETLKEEYVSKSNQYLNFRSHSMVFFTVIQPSTVEPDDSKPVDSKLQELENFLLLTKISNHSINHIIDSKHLVIVNIFALLKKFTQASFDCIGKNGTQFVKNGFIQKHQPCKFFTETLLEILLGKRHKKQ